jgi:Tfp pilus assembly protein PilN
MSGINLLEVVPPGESGVLVESSRVTTRSVAFLTVAVSMLAAVGWWVSAAEQAHLRALISAWDGWKQLFEDSQARTRASSARRDELIERASLAAHVAAQVYAPAAALSAIAASLPEGVWLTEVAQKEGSLEIGGRATSVGAVAEFAAALGDPSAGSGGRVEIRSATAEVLEGIPVFRYLIEVRGQ